MTILDKIIAFKRGEVAAAKARVPIAVLEKSIHFSRTCYSLTDSIRAGSNTGIITEFKRRSPSKGIINGTASVETTVSGYERAGAAALSVLTDKEFFGGANEDLVAARAVASIPILRKDFTIDSYQVVEARSIGADAILLIAAVLGPSESKELAALAHSLGMQVLLEVHDAAELTLHKESGADLIGVNNRNLKTFSVDIELSKKLAPLISDDVVKVSESGISSVDTILDLKRHGFAGFLMGENFMKQERPDIAAKEFMDQLRAELMNMDSKKPSR